MNILFIAFITLIYGLLWGTHPPPDNLLTEQAWQQFAGATVDTDGFRVHALDRTIAHQDGSRGQPNPPVHLTGSHLVVSGDFVVTVRMEEVDTSTTLRLYGKPPVVYDQWRYEPGSIAIAVATSSIVVRIWDGKASNSIDMRMYPFVLNRAVVVSIEHQGDTFVVSVDHNIVGTIPDHHIFDSKEVWFGFETTDSDGLFVRTVTAEPRMGGLVEVIPPPSFEVPHDDPMTLRNLADAHPRKIQIGAAVAYGALVTDEKYRTLALSEFTMITPENGMKPQFIHPQQDVYAFTEMDTLVDIALTNNLLVHGHALVYAKSNPDWMSHAPPAELQQIMVDHITTVVSHFKGRVAEWDVVNEPLSNKKTPYHNGLRGLEHTVWYEAMGEQYLDQAFRAAHEADPSALLYLNDYGLERDGERWDALVALVGRLKSRGVPIDGVGFESHVYVDGDYSDRAVLRAHMRTLETLGLKVRISEIDVVGDDPERQIEQYVIALDACLRASNCTGYSTWGITDLYGSTTRSDRYPLVYGTSLLFDKALHAKPTYTALQKRLEQPY